MYAEKYIDFLAHFHGDRDYFECHEILEEYWKESTDRKKNSIWVGLILLAVSTYHHRRGNFKGAKRTLEKAIRIFASQESSLTGLGLHPQKLFHLLRSQLAAIGKQNQYESFKLPIDDPILLEACKQTCIKKGMKWGAESDIADVNIVHRHKLRDRSSVINERLVALKSKKGSE